MRSDFYGLPYAARQAIQKGERDRMRAAGMAKRLLAAEAERDAIIEECIRAAEGTNADLCMSAGQAYRTMLDVLRNLKGTKA